MFKKIKKYNPYSYFKKDKTFIGKDIQSGSPVYIDDDLIKRQKMKHLVISGSTGCGKGAQTQVLLNQFLIKDYPVVAIDPNNDEFMIKSLKYNAEKRGKNFHLIDFKEYTKPQIDLLQGANSYEFTQITNTLFPALKIKDTDGNYYAQFSRDARQNYYEKELDGVSCMYDLHKKVFDKYGEEALKDANNNLSQFVTEFLNFAKIPMFMVKNSLSIKDAIENGDIIYILTPDLEADDELAYLCKAFLVRIIQIISNRDIATSRHVVFFIDEFGDYVNKILQKALQKIRKKKCLLILNLTSFDELMGIKSDVTGESVMHSIETNCIKILYEQGSVKSAQKASEMTGEHIVNVERKRLKTNDAQKDIKDNSETIIVPQKENIYSASMFSNLPEGVALYMNKGLPQLIHTEILRIPDNVEYPTLIQAEPYNANDSETDSEDSDDIMGAL
ncbi:type IV secretion system DNA-binding domain-containing protein [Francisella salimarina]|uniref:type IV secretion system DNA-binding domain-containing protein n=1 Tax=Francisella salimarina TaxID=2599927 RepID=UPI003D81BEB2